MTSSSAGLVVADIHGSIHILNQSFVSAASWVAHLGGRVTHMIERKGFLVTIGVCLYTISRVRLILDTRRRRKIMCVLRL